MSVEMTGRNDLGVVYISLKKTVDSNNAAETQAEIEKYLEPDVTGIVFDGKELAYISSAGLRIFLTLMKRYKNIKVINVSLDVYEIFRVTGFAEMITVEKSRRFVSVEGCEVIGVGSFGKVYRIDNDTIIKTFGKDTTEEVVKDEIEKAKIAFLNGIPTPISFDIVNCEDGTGLVFELVGGKTMAEVYLENPDSRSSLIRRYVELVKQIGEVELPEGRLPQASEIYKNQALSAADMISDPALLDAFCEFMDQFPKQNNLIHGDAHMKNFMFQNNEPVIIDMADICCGHPIFEIGSIFHKYFLLPFLRKPEVVRNSIGMGHEECPFVLGEFCKYYFEGLPEDIKNERIEACKIAGNFFLIHVRIARASGPNRKEEIERLNIELKELVDNKDRILKVVSEW